VCRRTDALKNKFSATGIGASHTSMLMREALGAANRPNAALTPFAQAVSASEAAVLRRALEELTRSAPEVAGRVESKALPAVAPSFDCGWNIYKSGPQL
jgi:hypothetical protein